MTSHSVLRTDGVSIAVGLGRYFAVWPTPFADDSAARDFLGDDASVDAWVADLEAMP